MNQYRAEWRRHDRKMQLRGRKSQAASSLLGTSRVDSSKSQSRANRLLVGHRGSMPRSIFPRPPVEGELFGDCLLDTVGVLRC